MRSRLQTTLLLAALSAGLVLMPTSHAVAQNFTTLYNFTALQSSTNVDGGYPQAGLVVSGNMAYGTATDGGQADYGTVFALDYEETNLTTLHAFTNGVDGSDPEAGLILSGNMLYGTAHSGGAAGNGTVFALNINGTGFTNLHSFTATSGIKASNGDGAYPMGGLVLSGGTLYGTASEGGALGLGTVFAVGINGSNFVTLHSFSNSADGAFPQAGLILSGNMLYGTAEDGGSLGNGTVFAIRTDGSGFTNLHSFSALVFNSNTQISTNRDGAYPQAGLVLYGNSLYGTAEEGGNSGNGTIFAVTTNGNSFTTLHSFSPVSNPHGSGVNGDGAYPLAGLILSGSVLYGTTFGGGASGSGAVFAIGTSGAGFMNLYSFSAPFGPYNENFDGAYPYGELAISGNYLLGTAREGGNDGDGTVFSLSFAPQLAIAISGTNAILTWPTNFTGFNLQSATNLVSPMWGTVSPSPVTVNGLHTVTNGISGRQKFYRLMQTGS